VQELAFTLSNGIAYVQAALEAGLEVDAFAPRLSFFFNAHNDLFQEVAKYRAARRIWARIMTERFGARDERSKRLRFHTQTVVPPSPPAARQQRVRVSLQALSAVLGAPRAFTPTASTRRSGSHTARGEARAPHPADHRIRVRRDRHCRPAGRFVLRRVAHQRGGECRLDYIARIDKLGGAVAAIESGFMQDEIEQAAYEYAKAVESGAEVVVGVNSFAEEDAGEPEVFPLEASFKRPDRSAGCFQGIARSSGIEAASTT